MSRFLDERGRIFGKVNVVDILVLLVIVAVIVFAVMRLSGNSVETVPMKLTFSVEQVRQPTVGQIMRALAAKGTVTDETGRLLGRMTDAKTEPTEVEFPAGSGTPDQWRLEKRPSLIFSDIEIAITGNGALSSTSARIGNLKLSVGKRVTLVGQGFEVQSVVTGVEPQSQVAK